jgi:hypothetical protein
MRLTIDVSGSGAVLTGTTRDDAPAIKALHDGWKWSRNLGAWYLPRTMRRETVDAKVARLAAAFAGDVEVIGGDERDSADDRAVRRYERDQELVGVHESRAERHDATAEAEYEKGRQIADMIPFGQPILVGHHSERRHRRDIDRIGRAMGASVDASRAADDERRKAQAAAHRVAKTDARKAGDRFGPDDVNVGDAVKSPWGPMLVLRVNAKTVTVPSFISGLPYTDTLPWRKVLAVIPGTDESRADAAAAVKQVSDYRANFDATRAAAAAPHRAKFKE